MNSDLRLHDYYDGHILRFKCKTKYCNHQWVEKPEDLLRYPHIHRNMDLAELHASVPCVRCRQHHIDITVILEKPHHHFVGGMV